MEDITGRTHLTYSYYRYWKSKHVQVKSKHVQVTLHTILSQTQNAFHQYTGAIHNNSSY